MGIGKNNAGNSGKPNSNYWSRQLKLQKNPKPTIFKKSTENLQEKDKPKFVSKDVKNLFAYNRNTQSRNSVTYDLDSIGKNEES